MAESSTGIEQTIKVAVSADGGENEKKNQKKNEPSQERSKQSQQPPTNNNCNNNVRNNLLVDQQTLFKVQASSGNQNDELTDIHDRQSLKIKLVKIDQAEDLSCKNMLHETQGPTLEAGSSKSDEVDLKSQAAMTELQNAPIIDQDQQQSNENIGSIEEEPMDVGDKSEQKTNTNDAFLGSFNNPGWKMIERFFGSGPSRRQNLPSPTSTIDQNSSKNDADNDKDDDNNNLHDNNEKEVKIETLEDATPTTLGRNRRVRQRNRYFTDFHCIKLAKGTRSRDDCDASGPSPMNARSAPTNRRSTTDTNRLSSGSQLNNTNDNETPFSDVDDEDLLSLPQKHCRKCRKRTSHDPIHGCQICLYHKITTAIHRSNKKSPSKPRPRPGRPRTKTGIVKSADATPTVGTSTAASDIVNYSSNNAELMDRFMDALQAGSNSVEKRKAESQLGPKTKMANTFIASNDPTTSGANQISPNHSSSLQDYDALDGQQTGAPGVQSSKAGLNSNPSSVSNMQSGQASASASLSPWSRSSSRSGEHNSNQNTHAPTSTDNSQTAIESASATAPLTKEEEEAERLKEQAEMLAARKAKLSLAVYRKRVQRQARQREERDRAMKASQGQAKSQPNAATTASAATSKPVPARSSGRRDRSSLASSSSARASTATTNNISSKQISDNQAINNVTSSTSNISSQPATIKHSHDDKQHTNQKQTRTPPDVNNILADSDMGRIETWTPEQVANYIVSTGFISEAEQFKTQSIDGISLLLMQRNDFTSNLNVKLGPALKLYDHVCKLKNQYFREAATAS